MMNADPQRVRTLVDRVVLPAFRDLERQYVHDAVKLPDLVRGVQDHFRFVDIIQPRLSETLMRHLSSLDASFAPVSELELLLASGDAANTQSERAEFYNVIYSARQTPRPHPAVKRKGFNFLNNGNGETPRSGSPITTSNRIRVTGDRVRGYQLQYRAALYQGVSIASMTDPALRKLLTLPKAEYTKLSDEKQIQMRIQAGLNRLEQVSTSGMLLQDENVDKYVSTLKIKWLVAYGTLASIFEVLSKRIDFGEFRSFANQYDLFIAGKVHDSYLGIEVNGKTRAELLSRFEARIREHNLDVINEELGIKVLDELIAEAKKPVPAPVKRYYPKVVPITPEVSAPAAVPRPPALVRTAPTREDTILIACHGLGLAPEMITEIRTLYASLEQEAGIANGRAGSALQHFLDLRQYADNIGPRVHDKALKMAVERKRYAWKEEYGDKIDKVLNLAQKYASKTPVVETALQVFTRAYPSQEKETTLKDYFTTIGVKEEDALFLTEYAGNIKQRGAYQPARGTDPEIAIATATRDIERIIKISVGLQKSSSLEGNFDPTDYHHRLIQLFSKITPDGKDGIPNSLLNERWFEAYRKYNAAGNKVSESTPDVETRRKVLEMVAQQVQKVHTAYSELMVGDHRAREK